MIEHRCPDLVVPLQRVGEVNASMASQTEKPKRVKTLWVYEKAAGGQVGRQADCRRASRQISRKTYWQDDRQASKQGMASKVAHKTSYHILMCGTLAQNGMRKRPDADQEEKAKKSSL